MPQALNIRGMTATHVIPNASKTNRIMFQRAWCLDPPAARRSRCTANLLIRVQEPQAGHSHFSKTRQREWLLDAKCLRCPGCPLASWREL